MTNPLHRGRLRSFAAALSVLFAVCAGLFPSSTIGQVNTERLRSEKDGTTASVSGSLSYRSGNSERLDVATALRVDYRDAKNYTFLVGRLSYGTNNSTTYSNASFVHLRYNRELSRIFVGEAFGQLERDGFTLLQLRALLGAGIRIAYPTNEKLSVFQGSSVMYENERLDSEVVIEHPDRISTARWSNYVSVVGKLTEVATLISTTYVQPKIDNFGDIRLINDTSVEVKLTDQLVLTTTFAFRHDADPPDGVEDTDILLRNGLRFQF